MHRCHRLWRRLVAAASLLIAAGCAKGPAEIVYVAGNDLAAVDPARGKILWRVDAPGRIADIAVSPDGRLVGVATDSAFVLVDAARRSAAATWKFGAASAVEMSADGFFSYVLVGPARRGSVRPKGRIVYCVRNSDRAVRWNADLGRGADGLALGSRGREVLAYGGEPPFLLVLLPPALEGPTGRTLAAGVRAVPFDTTGGFGALEDLASRVKAENASGRADDTGGAALLWAYDSARGIGTRWDISVAGDAGGPGPVLSAGDGRLYLPADGGFRAVDASFGAWDVWLQPDARAAAAAMSEARARIYFFDPGRERGLGLYDVRKGRLSWIGVPGARGVIAVAPGPRSSGREAGGSGTGPSRGAAGGDA
jgi:hypothetical protein